MMADDMADDDDNGLDDLEVPNEVEPRSIAVFAASSSSQRQNTLRSSPYLSSSTNHQAFRGHNAGSSSTSEVDMATFSPQPSSSGSGSGAGNQASAASQNHYLNNIATTSTSSVSSASGAVMVNTSEPIASTSRYSSSFIALENIIFNFFEEILFFKLSRFA